MSFEQLSSFQSTPVIQEQRNPISEPRFVPQYLDLTLKTLKQLENEEPETFFLLFLAAHTPSQKIPSLSCSKTQLKAKLLIDLEGRLYAPAVRILCNYERLQPRTISPQREQHILFILRSLSSEAKQLVFRAIELDAILLDHICLEELREARFLNEENKIREDVAIILKKQTQIN